MAEVSSSRKNQVPNIPKDLLNDLSSRFIINVPEEERVDLTRLCFQIELAHWFYLDFYCEENPKLPRCNVKEFIHVIFRHIPFLQKYQQEIDSVIANWREYKSAVPTYGAIILDKDLKKVLLVQSYYSKASWGFPKGKVNEDEKPHLCAIREVYEETGFDITDFINIEEYLEHYFNEQLIRLYIITGISPDAKFHPKTRKEIKSIEWFAVNQLPTGKKDEISRYKLGPNNFFMVMPFVKKLQRWISAKEKLAHEVDQDNYYLKQQHLFSQLTKKDFEKYTNLGENPENKSSRSENKSSYSPPPRLLRQRLKQNEKRRSSLNFQEDRIIINSNLKKKLFEEVKEEEKNKMENGIWSSTWANATLDCEALIATFSINLRKTLPLQKNSIESHYF